MEIRIARNGKEIGVFDEKSLARAIAEGAVQRDDWAWYEGLPSWLPVWEFIDGPPPPLIPNQKPSEPRRESIPPLEATGPANSTDPKAPPPATTPGNVDERDWTRDIATLKQLHYLEEFGVKPKSGLTKGEARSMIDRLIDEKPKVAAEHERQKTRRKLDHIRELRDDLAESKRQLKAARGRGNIDFHREAVEALKKRLEELTRSSGCGCGCLPVIVALIVAYSIYLLIWK